MSLIPHELIKALPELLKALPESTEAMEQMAAKMDRMIDLLETLVDIARQDGATFLSDRHTDEASAGEAL